MGMRKNTLIFLGLSLAGCATEGKFREHMDSWVGQPISNMIQQIGMPAQSMDVPGEGRDYLWMNRGGMVYGVQLSCDITVMTDAQNIIRSWQAKGTACISK